MGEIFDRPAPSQELEWTGERLTSAVSGQIEIEHLHRYFFARTFCRDADVLDVASGEGYGSNLLAQVARSVVGVEVDPAAAAHAARAYGRSNLSYVNGDARALPLPDASVDVVVSFETLEHFFEHEQFLAEVKRVLRPGGRFIISSPDRDVYSPLGSSANPFHVNELTRHEFERLLSSHFRQSFMFLQRPVLGSVLFPEGQSRGVLSFERRGENHYEASSGIPRAPYNLVVASDGDLDEAQASVFFETSAIGDILSQVAERAKEQVAFAQVREEYEAQVRATRAELRAAEDGTRSALSRAERAEETLAHLSATRSLEVEAVVAGLREELRAVTLAAEQHVARAAAAEQALATTQSQERAARDQSDQLLSALREDLVQAREALKAQHSRASDLEQKLAVGQREAEQAMSALRGDLTLAREALKVQHSRASDLEQKLAAGQREAEQAMSALRGDLAQAREALKVQHSRVSDLEQRLATVQREAEQVTSALRGDLTQAREALKVQHSRASDLEQKLAAGQREAEQVIAGLRDGLKVAESANREHLSRTADLARDLSTVTSEHRAVLRDLEAARAELARTQALLDKARAEEGERAAIQRKLDQRTTQLEQAQGDLLAATERLLVLEAELQRAQADLASSLEAAVLSAPAVDPEVAGSAAPAGKRPKDVADQGEVALLRDTVKALQAQIVTLQSQKDAAGLSLRIQASLMQKMRGAGLQEDHRAVARMGREGQVSQVDAEAWRELFEHTRGSVETVMRFSGMRLLPKATRTWVRRKIYGPRWIR